MSKEWAPAEADAFQPKLVELCRSHSWGRGNPLHEKMRTGLDETAAKADKAYKMIQAGRFSPGQALLKRVQLEEGTLRGLKLQNEIDLLDKLDGLGIDREWHNTGADPMPRLLFHFRLAGGGRHTLDLTAEDLE